jgi:two-component system chemotaxis response regulator CheB
MISVLIADDSPTSRALLVRVLRADPEFTVVGEAKDSAEAVELALSLRPGVIVMGIGQPQIDAFETTKRIMFQVPTPVVLVTAATGEVAVSLEALRAGALTVLCRPPSPGAAGFEDEARRFVRMIKGMSQVKVVRRWPDPHRRPSPSPAPLVLRRDARARVVAMAASTGGPAALQRVLHALPPEIGAPILVVQHISRGFGEGLTRWLGAGCRLQVKLAENGEPLAAGTVYVAPHDRHLGVSSLGQIDLVQSEPIDGFRPSATHLFRSVARAFGPTSLAVMLTGMGHDGVEGLRAVQHAGGTVVAQDEATSVIYGMPGAAVSAGLTHLVLPLDVIAAHIVQSVA